MTPDTPTGGLLSAWVTDEPGRAEGYHSFQPDGPLLIIINEAKTVPDEIFDALGRCTYSLMLEIGTGGPKRGRFYEHFTKVRSLYKTYAITWDDCPHIPQEKKDQIIHEFGEDDPYTRSTVFGEFMNVDDSEQYIFTLADVESNREANIGRIAGATSAGIDFGGGIDLNVLIKRVGNWIEPGWIHGWPQRDTYAAAGRFLELINRLGLDPSEIWGDADGLGLGFCNHLDAMLKSNINRFHGGSASPHPRYKNLISYAWHQVSEKVARHRIKVPNHQALIEQLTSRQVKWSNDGRLWLESKEDMKNRGLKSPDFGDAFVMAFFAEPIMGRSWIRPDDSRFAEISREHGWEYNSDLSDSDDDSYMDRRTWNRPNRPGDTDRDHGPFHDATYW